jgi:hypothetical protein
VSAARRHIAPFRTMVLGNHAVFAYWPEAAQCSCHRAIRLGRCLGRRCPPPHRPRPGGGCAPRGALVIVVLFDFLFAPPCSCLPFLPFFSGRPRGPLPPSNCANIKNRWGGGVPPPCAPPCTATRRPGWATRLRPARSPKTRRLRRKTEGSRSTRRTALKSPQEAPCRRLESMS